MRKLLLLMGLSILGVLMFAPMAFGQLSPPVSAEDCSNWRATPDGWQCSNLPDVGNFREILGPPPTATATPTATPSAAPTATSSATSSATATATASAAGAAQYQYAPALPSTGGVSPVTLLAIIPAILLLGGGLLSARLIRRS